MKGLVKHRIISAKRNKFTVKTKALLLLTFTLTVRINLLYSEYYVTSTKAVPLFLLA